MDGGARMDRAILFLLPEPTDEVPEALERMHASGRPPRMLLTDYDHGYSSDLEGETLLAPMDILEADDVAEVFRKAFEWRAGVWSHVEDPGLRRTLPAWLPAATQHVLLLIRLSRLVARAIEGASAYAVAGKHSVFPYYRTVIHRVAARCGVPVEAWQAEEAAVAVSAGTVSLPENVAAAVEACTPLKGELPPLTMSLRAQEGIEAFGRTFGSRWGEPTIVLLMRFRSGVSWFHDSRTGELLRHDSYNELYMERLADRCRRRGWRLALLSLDGDGERPEGARTLAEMYPGTVTEILPTDFKYYRSVRRRDGEEGEWARIGRFFLSSAYRQAMALDGVETHDLLPEGYFSMMAVLHAKLAVSEGVDRLLILKALRPAAIVGARLEGFADCVRAAEALGVPSVSLRFGIGHEMTLSGMDEVDSLATSVKLAWGEIPSRYLSTFAPGIRALGLGRPRNDVFVLEGPRVDKAAVKARLGMDAQDRLILIGLNCRTRFAELSRGRGQGIVSPQTFEQVVDVLAGLAERLGRIRIIMKPHESDDMDMLQDVLTRKGRGVASLIRNAVDGFHNVELLAATELLVANASSMMAEAACCGVPSIMLATPDTQFFFEEERIAGYGTVGRRAESVDELAALAEDFLCNAESRGREVERALEGVRLYFGAADGRNADRTADAICRIVEQALREKTAPKGTGVHA